MATAQKAQTQLTLWGWCRSQAGPSKACAVFSGSGRSVSDALIGQREGLMRGCWFAALLALLECSDAHADAFIDKQVSKQTDVSAGAALGQRLLLTRKPWLLAATGARAVRSCGRLACAKRQRAAGCAVHRLHQVQRWQRQLRRLRPRCACQQHVAAVRLGAESHLQSMRAVSGWIR